MTHREVKSRDFRSCRRSHRRCRRCHHCCRRCHRCCRQCHRYVSKWFGSKRNNIQRSRLRKHLSINKKKTKIIHKSSAGPCLASESSTGCSGQRLGCENGWCDDVMLSVRPPLPSVRPTLPSVRPPLPSVRPTGTSEIPSAHFTMRHQR